MSFALAHANDLRAAAEKLGRFVRDLEAENLAMRRALDRIDANAPDQEPRLSHVDMGLYAQAKIAREAKLGLSDGYKLTRLSSENQTLERATDAMLAALAHYFLGDYDGPETNVPGWVHEMEESLADLLVGNKGAFLRSERIRKLVNDEMENQRTARRENADLTPAIPLRAGTDERRSVPLEVA